MALTEGNGLTASDVALLTGNNGNNGFGGWGDSAWIIIFLIFALGGWGNGNGWGGNGNSAQDVKDGYTLASDFATLERQIDSGFNSVERKGDYIQEQICNSDATRANQIATVQASLMDGFAGVNQGISANRYETQLAVGNAQNGITGAVTDLSRQLSDCCCQNRYDNLQNSNAIQSQLANMNYDNLMNSNLTRQAISDGFCQSNYNNATNTRDIIDNQNANTRAILDSLMASKLEAKQDKIDELQSMLNNANLRASQLAQTNAIDNKIEALGDRLQPTPVPAFSVPNPFNYGNGCGCGYSNY